MVKKKKNHNSSQLFTVCSVSTLCTSLHLALIATLMRQVLLSSFYKDTETPKDPAMCPQVNQLVSRIWVSVTQMILISSLPFTCCVALDKLLSFSELKFLLPRIRLLHSVFPKASLCPNFL